MVDAEPDSDDDLHTETVEVREAIPTALDGERLDRVVSFLTGMSRAEAAGLVALGDVTVNGRTRTTKSTRLATGDEVVLHWRPAGPAGPIEADATVSLTVVHEDTDVVVLDKPAGIVVHPGAGNATGTLVQGLLARYPELAQVGDPERPGIVHRIDK
jgi:23S rRNA pseudouridine1911/1915/1917 synthase